MIHITTARGIHDMARREGRLMMMVALRSPDMAAERALCDDQQFRRRAQQTFGHNRQIPAAGGFFGEIAGENAQMARLQKITHRFTETPGPAVKRSLNATTLRQGKGRAAGLFMTPVEMQQAHAIQQ